METILKAMGLWLYASLALVVLLIIVKMIASYNMHKAKPDVQAFIEDEAEKASVMNSYEKGNCTF